MRKYLILLFLISLFPYNIFAQEQLKDGWHLVPSLTDKSDYNWVYYKYGVEQKRYSSMIYAHRGWGDAPENSLASIKHVKENGYYAYETDVRFTKDGIPVLIHDSTINRVARNSDLSEIKETIYVKDLTYSELSKYSFCVTHSGEVLKDYKKNKITKFEDAISYSKETGLTLQIELKVGSKSQIASLVKIVKKYDMDNVVKWISSKEKLLSYVNAAEDDEFIGIIVKDRTEEELAKVNQELKTANNTVVGIDIINTHHLTLNMPEEMGNHIMSRYVLNTIPQGTLKLNKTSLKTSKGKTETISYTYNGDGVVKCSSPDTKLVTCKVDKKKKTITVQVLKAINSKVVLNIYGTQGIQYSATKDVNLTLQIKIKGDVNNDGVIKVADYLMIRKHLLSMPKLTGDDLKRADVNGDGKVNPSDYIVIRKIILGVN